MGKCESCNFDYTDCSALAWFDYSAQEEVPFLSECDKYVEKIPEPKPTRFDRIMAEMTVDKMAELLTDKEERCNSMGEYKRSIYSNDAGFYDFRADAISAEKAWLEGCE